MKFYAFFLISFIAMCYADEVIKLSENQHQRALEAGKVCIAQEGTSPEAIQQLRSGNFANADHKSKCFLNCFLEKLNIIQNGAPHAETIKKELGPIIGEEKAAVIMQECNGIHGADNCETGFKLYECYHKHNAAALS